MTAPSNPRPVNSAIGHREFLFPPRRGRPRLRSFPIWLARRPPNNGHPITQNSRSTTGRVGATFRSRWGGLQCNRHLKVAPTKEIQSRSGDRSLKRDRRVPLGGSRDDTLSVTARSIATKQSRPVNLICHCEEHRDEAVSLFPSSVLRLASCLSPFLLLWPATP